VFRAQVIAVFGHRVVGFIHHDRRRDSRVGRLRSIAGLIRRNSRFELISAIRCLVVCLVTFAARAPKPGF
jgi:hypothetical protein